MLKVTTNAHKWVLCEAGGHVIIIRTDDTKPPKLEQPTTKTVNIDLDSQYVVRIQIQILTLIANMHISCIMWHFEPNANAPQPLKSIIMHDL